MTSIRLTFRSFIAAMLLAAFSLPAGAADPEKIYSINVPTPLGTNPVAVTIKNETPNGNSTINSFVIQPPAGVSVTVANPKASAAADVTKGADGKIYVKSFDGLKSGNRTPKTLTVYLNATFDPAPTCERNYTWTAVVYTGNAFGSETFALSVGNPVTNPTQSSTCKYSITMTPSAVPAGTQTTLTARVTNNAASTTPIASVTLTPPSGSGLSIVGSNTFLTSIAPGASQNITVPVAAVCGATGGTWGSSARSSALAAFTLTPAGSNPATSVGPACRLNLVPPQPGAVVSGADFSVLVEALDGNDNRITDFAGPVTLSLNTISGSGNLVPVGSSASGGVVTATAKIEGAGEFTVTATSSLGSASFNVTTTAFTVYLGELNCDPEPPFKFANVLPPGITNINQPGYAEGQRGAYNKDGTSCVAVEYTFTNDILDNNTVNLKWNVATQPGAAFKYTMTWKPEYVDGTTGMPSRVTKLAWYDPTGTTLMTPVPGRACLSPSLPAPYGTLAAPIDAVQTAISVTVTSLPPATPFPILIGAGVNAERMTVTAVSGGAWTVLRGQGGTTAGSAVAQASGASVMSTPLPLDESGNQMRMCIVEEGWSALPAGVNDCPTATTPSPTVPVPTAPLACVLYTTTVFDIGDGTVSRGGL